FKWTGKIFDANTGEPLMYALIQTEDQRAYTFSDEDGRFNLGLSPSHSDSKVIIHALGFEDQIFQTSGLLPKKIQLEPTGMLLSEITILEDKPAHLLSGRYLESRRRNGASPSGVGGLYADDIFRQIQISTPGITAHDDGSAGLQIRGGDADETLIVLDDIPIYRADHFYGIFSGINSQYIDEYQVYKNAIPIEYGGKMSGMVNMDSKETLLKPTGYIQADLLAASASFSSPLGSGLGISLAGRTSYTNLTKNNSFDLSSQQRPTDELHPFTRTNVLVSTPDFDFHDYNAKLFYENKAFRIEGNLFGSHDLYDNQYTTEFRIGDDQDIKFGKELFSHINSWDNLGGSLSASYQLGNWTLRGTTYFSDYETNNALVSDLDLDTATGGSREAFNITTDNTVQDRGQKFQASFNGNKWGTSVGLDMVQHETKLDIDAFGVSALDRTISGNETTLFGEVHIEPIPELQLSLGSRFTNFRDTWFALPQLQAKYFIGDHLSFKGSVSRKAQFVREITFQDRLGQTSEYLILAEHGILPVGRSNNFMLGGSLYFSRFNLDAEFYIKDSEGVLEFSSRKLGIERDNVTPMGVNDFQIFRGTGKVRGMDLALQYLDGPYQSSLANTLSKSTNQFEKIYQNSPFPSANDSRHQVKWSNQFEVKPFTFFASYVFASGRPYTDISKLNMEVLINDADPASLIERLPDYHRLDVGADFTFPLGKTKGTIGLSCFNLTDHKNVKFLQYIYKIPGQGTTSGNEVVGTETLQLERTWNVKFALEF
ncbi:MAG: TonB-dependent receptor plug domain-containing protein, partial [Saprospiraceae bacterium]|nr:TonB-dependent receptor plug domain-containing protein [Saprospiraceae bacterium]